MAVDVVAEKQAPFLTSDKQGIRPFFETLWILSLEYRWLPDLTVSTRAE
jgi:hypothetical protein